MWSAFSIDQPEFVRAHRKRAHVELAVRLRNVENLLARGVEDQR